MKLHKVTRAVTLTLFLGLLLSATYPFPDGLNVDFFLRLDPLVSVGTIIASRDLAVYLFPGLLVLVAALLIGRFYCGHICPMGTTLDILDGLLGPRKRSSRRNNTY